MRHFDFTVLRDNAIAHIVIAALTAQAAQIVIGKLHLIVLSAIEV